MHGRTYLYMNQTPYLRLQKIARGQASTTDFLTQNINYTETDFGKFAGFYAGIPCIVLKDGAGVDMLSNTKGDGSSTTVYGVTYGPENFTGFEDESIKFHEMKEISVMEAFDLEWGIGTAPQSKRCVAKLQYVANSVT